MINVEKEIGGKVLTLETGKIARQSAGSVLTSYDETGFTFDTSSLKFDNG